MHPTVEAAIEGAQHTEYELRTVRKLMPLEHDGKSRLLLTGILDLVIQQEQPLRYQQIWRWTDIESFQGDSFSENLIAQTNDLEIWDYKGTRFESEYLTDYVMQMLTYANLYHERTGRKPKRCVLFFVNEPKLEKQLLAIPLDDNLLDKALKWTIERVKELQQTTCNFRNDPNSVTGGDEFDPEKNEWTISTLLTLQCTACGQRFGCSTYINRLEGGKDHNDVRLENVFKN